jgi:predicted ATPase
MKLKKLNINSYLHLKDLEFDFTYPENHEKAGQPLEKICFIGQSATGKTNLLKFIANNLVYLLQIKIADRKYIWDFEIDEEKINGGEIELLLEDINIKLNDKILSYGNINYDFNEEGGGLISDLIYNPQKNNKVLYFTSNYITDENIKYFNAKPLEIVFNRNRSKYSNIDNFSFDENSSDTYILKLLESFLDYRQKYDTKVRELLQKGYISDIDKFNREFKKWQVENPSPIDDFSEKFDLLLNKLNLEIDRINVDYPIPFKNKKTEEIIPINGLSTGTKGLLLYMLPLYQIDTSKSIILIDEPERSLYPDMQMELMDFFRKLSPKSQFIIATHSPFIAASFEPEERFILYFDENGDVKVRRGSSPIGDDPNDILANDFGINYINKYGQKAFEEYKNLKQKIYFEKNEKKKEEISKKLEELGEKYNF